jgi:hypothetical protein
MPMNKLTMYGFECNVFTGSTSWDMYAKCGSMDDAWGGESSMRSPCAMCGCVDRLAWCWENL